MGGEIDPDVELLADVPIAGPEEDLFDRTRVAQRVLELATADPVTAPRMVALTGAVGAGGRPRARPDRDAARREAPDQCDRGRPAARAALRGLIDS